MKSRQDMREEIKDMVTDSVIYKDADKIPTFVSWEKPEDDQGDFD